MRLGDLDLPKQLVYHAHRFVRDFRPIAEGSEAGMEFEDRFRDTLAARIPFDLISSKRDMGLGQGLVSRSGLSHELDLISRLSTDFFTFELKHYAESQINKEMVMVFHQKVLDFYLENYAVLEQFTLHRLFVTRSAQIDVGIRQFCAAWGILLVDPHLLSLPICEIIVDAIHSETMQGVPPDWAQPEQLESLKERSADLTVKMWRGLDVILSLQAGLPDGLYLDLRHVPPAHETARWVAEQMQLSREVRELQARFIAWKKGKSDG